MLSVLVLINLFFLLCLARIAATGEPPTISEHPLDILVAKDDPATLRCEAEGEGVEITWYKDSEPVKVGNGHRLLLPDGSLLLLKVKSGGPDSDAGVYYCVAKNKFGEVRSQEANLRVAMLREEFRINPHSVQALIGNRVTLDCLPPKGFPEPVVSWRKDERELNTQNNEKYQLLDSGNLVVENVCFF
uniref:Ig-like domain-containing protein n=1 Tax=Meloidogyne incognita TaxID=6306 RepID=A0A914KPJ1_MELIC